MGFNGGCLEKTMLIGRNLFTTASEGKQASVNSAERNTDENYDNATAQHKSARLWSKTPSSTVQ
jgi:hypothetical protein